MHSDLELSVW